MANAICAELRDALRRILPEGELRFCELSEERSWSRVYLVQVEQNRRVYVKGTLRAIPEARTTVRLAVACPDLVPVVLHPDLLPESDWHWFAMADAGECAHLELTPEQAYQAALALGELQRKMQTDTFLESLLPSCLPDQVYQITRASCEWLVQNGDAALCARAQPLYADLLQQAPVFHVLSSHLAQLPPACVHGDFWPGNIALRGTDLRIIDWREAVWGIGGASIWNLLLSSQSTLTHASSAIWEAYGRGRQQSIGQEYIDAARVAFYVAMLVIDRHYGNREDIETMQGMLVTLENVLKCLERL